MPEPDLADLRAKMIALAISSVASDYRLNLIQAVLGLVSYLGHEAEKVQKETASADEDQAPSELMSYRSLGVVLGPLLLGNLTDSAVHGNSEGHSGTPRTSLEMDSAKKFRKHKRKHSDMKLDQSATLAAFVDRANRTAIVMQQLLSLWPNVVKQLRDINSTASSSLKSGSKRRLKKISNRAGSRLTMDTSEEDMKFLDILRGRTLPEEFRGAVRMKSNIRLTSRSPMSRGAIGPSEDDSPKNSWFPPANEEHGSPSSSHTRVAERAARDNEFAVDNQLRSVEGTNISLTDNIGFGIEHRTHSDIAMEKMAMGTILPPLQIKPSPSPSKEFLRLIDPIIETPRKVRISSSTGQTPRTALRDGQTAEHSHESDDSKLRISLEKPLPPIGDAQRAELSTLSPRSNAVNPPFNPFLSSEHLDSPRRNASSRKSSEDSFSSRKARRSAERTICPSRHSGQWPSSPPKQTNQEVSFPPRQSSLPMDNHLALKPIETYSSLAEYKAKADTYMSPPKFNVSRKGSEAQPERNKIPDGGPRPNNVKVLTQRFAEASRAMRSSNEQPKETAIPRIYALVNSLPPPLSPMFGLDDPFLSVESKNASRESLIPKPVRDVGRSRESRSLSPPKRAAPIIIPSKRHSAFGVVTDQDAEIVKQNTISSPPATPTAGEGEDYEEMQVTNNGIGFSKQPLTQLLDASHHQRSAESLRRLHTYLDESPSETRSTHKRTISFAELARPKSPSHLDSPSSKAHVNPKDSPIRSNSYLNASDALKPLERHTSINATMYSEICRLQRLLQQMGEEKEAKDRRIEALEEVQGGNPAAAGVKAEGSFRERGMHNEVRQAKRELGIWRMRAELAESSLKQLSRRSQESKTMYPVCPEPNERRGGCKKQGHENEMGDIRNMQEDSPNSWKRRTIIAESQLAQISNRDCAGQEIDVQEIRRGSPDSWERSAGIAESELTQTRPLMEKGPHSEAVRTTPAPLMATVYVAVETERSLSNSEYSESNSEEEMGRRSGPKKTSRGSNDRSSDFASALNGFG